MPKEPKVDYSASAIPKPGKREREPKKPKARKPMRRWNPERVEERKEVTDGPQSDACRAIGVCCCCGRAGMTVPHHEPPRSVGGIDADTLPLLNQCHGRRHQQGPLTFWRQVGLDPEDLKAGMRAWVSAGCPNGTRPFGGGA